MGDRPAELMNHGKMIILIPKGLNPHESVESQDRKRLVGKTDAANRRWLCFVFVRNDDAGRL